MNEYELTLDKKILDKLKKHQPKYISVETANTLMTTGFGLKKRATKFPSEDEVDEEFHKKTRSSEDDTSDMSDE